MERRKAIKWMKGLCISFAIIGMIFIWKGFDKILNYSNPDSEYSFSKEYENSYVGGDAYNYIINGTYFTGYAVLGAGSLIISAISGIVGAVISIKSEEELKKEEQLPEL